MAASLGDRAVDLKKVLEKLHTPVGVFEVIKALWRSFHGGNLRSRLNEYSPSVLRLVLNEINYFSKRGEARTKAHCSLPPIATREGRGHQTRSRAVPVASFPATA
jgi:hypothetical protein